MAMKLPAVTASLLASLSLALPGGVALANPGGNPPPAAMPQAATQAAAVDAITPRLNQISAQVAATLQRIDALQGQIQALSNSVDAHSKSINALTSRADNVETALSLTQKRVQKRLEADAQALETNTTRLGELQTSLAAAQQDLAALREQMAQVENALVKHSAWIAKQKMESDTASTTASEALARAVAAGKLAEGKLVYETVLSEEMTQFQPYKADLSDAAKSAIKAFAEKLKSENGNIYLEIQGHTDTSGPKPLNQRLSLQRAEAVRDFLKKECGIPLHRMEAVAYGDSKPMADNSTKEGRAQNRRVTVVVLE